MAATVISVGTATLDRIMFLERMPAPGAKMRAHDYIEIGGGQAANAAVAVARLGGHAVLWSAVGGDAAGETILEGLAGEGVDTSGIMKVAAARSVTAAVLVERSGERTIVADYDRRFLGATPAFDLARIAMADALLCDVKWPEAQEPSLREAKARGVPTVLDIEPAPVGYHDRIVPLADHAVFGRMGLAAYTGTDDVAEGLRIARERTGAVVGVTLGAAGSRFLTGDDEIDVPALPVAVVDTAAAGDAFHGAYALAIAEGRGVAEVARLASVVASLKCARPGGRAGLPARAEVDEILGRAP